MGVYVSTPFLPNGSHYFLLVWDDINESVFLFQHLFFLMEVATFHGQYYLAFVELAEVSTPFLPNGSRYTDEYPVDFDDAWQFQHLFFLMEVATPTERRARRN